ncbi:MAG: hypothetical protein Q9194_004591 [Teloschistes cf. exilis]
MLKKFESYEANVAMSTHLREREPPNAHATTFRSMPNAPSQYISMFFEHVQMVFFE